jgi:phosphatidylglycerol lysyltransferase
MQKSPYAPSDRIGIGRSHFMAVPVLLVAIWMVSNRLPVLEIRGVFGAIADFSLWQWCVAAVATAISLFAIGGYDATAHRLLQTGISTSKARSAGLRAIAIAQLVGFGTVTAGLVRCRLLMGLSIGRIGALSAFVSLSFFAAWAVLTGIAVLLTDLPFPSGGALWGGGVLALSAPIMCWFWRDRLQGVGLRAFTTLLFWAFTDTVSASVVLWIFLPEGLPFGQVFAAYLLALGSGLLSNSPGGLGPFDLCLIVLLPEVEIASLLSAIFAYRLVYLVAPALISVPSLIWPAPVVTPPLQCVDAADVVNPCPEWGLHRQSAEILSDNARVTAHLARRTGSFLVGIGRPLNFGDPQLVSRTAAAEGRRVALYKLDSRGAVIVRRCGWSCLQVGTDAMIDLKDWTLDTPRRRQLRRKLKQAAKAGIEIRQSRPTDLPDMVAIAKHWKESHGKEWGFSMGLFEPEYLAHQRTFLALERGAPAAFISVHVHKNRWVLDIMRHGDDIPSGTMHALVVAAIIQAKSEGVTHMSLAAVPPAMPWLSRWLRPGLKQFKDAFVPRWEPLYICTAQRWHMPMALLSIARAVVYPVRYSPKQL